VHRLKHVFGLILGSSANPCHWTERTLSVDPWNSPRCWTAEKIHESRVPENRRRARQAPHWRQSWRAPTQKRALLLAHTRWPAGALLFTSTLSTPNRVTGAILCRCTALQVSTTTTACDTTTSLWQCKQRCHLCRCAMQRVLLCPVVCASFRSWSLKGAIVSSKFCPVPLPPQLTSFPPFPFLYLCQLDTCMRALRGVREQVPVRRRMRSRLPGWWGWWFRLAARVDEWHSTRIPNITRLCCFEPCSGSCSKISCSSLCRNLV